MNNKGYTSIEIFLVVAFFSAIYLVGLVNVSYSFNTDNDKIAYSESMNLIEKQSEMYASLNSDLFIDASVIYIYVNDLIESKLIATNKDGNYCDPTNENNILNNLKIKIVLKNGEYKANIIKI